MDDQKGLMSQQPSYDHQYPPQYPPSYNSMPVSQQPQGGYSAAVVVQQQPQVTVIHTGPIVDYQPAEPWICMACCCYTHACLCGDDCHVGNANSLNCLCCSQRDGCKLSLAECVLCDSLSGCACCCCSSKSRIKCDPKKWTLINRSAVCCCCDQRCAFPPTEKWQPFYIACCNRVCVGQKPVFDSPAIRLIKAEGISINEED